MRKLKIGGAALNQTPIDWDLNLGNIKSAIQSAKQQNIDILCLPELCITGYGCEDLFLSDWLLDKACEKLLKVVDWCDNVSVAVGLPLKLSGNIYNCLCIIDNQEILGFYAKQHLPVDGVYYESRWK